MENKPQTSIDWLYDEMIKLIKGRSKCNDDKEILHQAKMMYNEEMMNEFGRGYDEGMWDCEAK